MEKNVTSSTNRMANQSISDWNRLQRAYSNPITGRVSITRTTTERVVQGREVTPAMYSIEEASNLRTRLNLPDVSRYVTQGSYYNYNSNNTVGKNDNKIDEVLSKITKLIDKINSRNSINELEGLKVEIPIYLDSTVI